jgi:integrase
MSSSLQGASVAGLLETLLAVVGPQLDEQTKARLAVALKRPIGKRRGRPKGSRKQITVTRLCRLYNEHCEVYYRRSDGVKTTESGSVRHALKPLRTLFGRRPISDLGPRRLIQVREEMIKLGWGRKHINEQVGRIARMVKWGIEQEIVPAAVYHALQAVRGLRAGRSAAPEGEPVRPVPEPLIEAVFPHVSTQVKAMIQVQLITGMRPGEVVIMRTSDIDRSEQPWVYKPSHHKTQHHHHERLVYFGPRSQEIVQPFLKLDRPHDYIFSPVDAERERRERMHALRKTPMSCGNEPGSNRRRRPLRSPGDRYEPQSYGRAISRGLELAFPTPEGLSADEAKRWRREHHWHPHRLRHNAATKLRKEFGLDVAQVVLGHKTVAITQVYAERDAEAAQRTMLKVG